MVQSPTQVEALGRIRIVPLVASTGLMTALSTWQYASTSLGPYIVMDLSLSKASFGALSSIFFGVAAAASPSVGRQADKRGPWVLAVTLIGVAVVGIVVSSLSVGYALLALGAVFGGLGAAGGNPVANQVLYAAYRPAQHGRLIGLKQAGVPIAAVPIGLLLPYIAAGQGWRFAMVLGALLPLAVAGLWIFLYNDGTLGRRAVEPSGQGIRNDAHQLSVSVSAGGRTGYSESRQKLSVLTVYAFAMGSVTAIANVFVPLYAVEALGLSRSEAGGMVAVLGGSAIVGRIMWGRRADAVEGTESLLRLLALGSVVAVGILALSESVASSLAWSVLPLVGCTVLAWNGIAMLAAVRLGTDLGVGAASGQVQRAFFVGVIAAPVVAGLVLDALQSYVAVWGISMGAAALAFIFASMPQDGDVG